MLVQIKALKPPQAKRVAAKLKIYSNFGFNDKDLSPLSKKAKTKSQGKKRAAFKGKKPGFARLVKIGECSCSISDL